MWKHQMVFWRSLPFCLTFNCLYHRVEVLKSITKGFSNAIKITRRGCCVWWDLYLGGFIFLYLGGLCVKCEIEVHCCPQRDLQPLLLLGSGPSADSGEQAGEDAGAAERCA